MISVYFVLLITYIFMIELFGFIALFPLMRDLVPKEIIRDEFSARVMAFILTLGALVYVFPFAYYQLAFIIATLTVLTSLLSGFSLIALSRIYRVNIFLFIFSIMLSILSPYILPYIVLNMATLYSEGDLMIVCNFINELIYLIGVGEGAVKYLYPVFKDFYTGYNRESYAMALTALLITIWILTVVLRLVGVETTLQLPQAEDFSTIAFTIGGLIGCAVLISTKRQRTVCP